MARPTIHLHVGLFKTGTTFLQNTFRANQERLLTHGFDVPDGRDGVRQTFAVSDLQGRRRQGVRDGRIAGQWEALVGQIDASQASDVLISVERLSLFSLRQARRAVASFPDHDVRVVVTARDLARAAVSSWYEDVKNDHTVAWPDFVAAIRDPERAAVKPARAFWMAQDLARVLATWEAATSVEQVTLVTVPPAGSDAGSLRDRFCEAVRCDPALLADPPPWNNEMIEVPGIEVVRRLNERMAGRLNQLQYDRWVKRGLVHRLAKASSGGRLSMSGDDLTWAQEHAEQTIGVVGERGYRVLGDLDDLRPRLVPGARQPDEFTEAEVLDAALEALAAVTEEAAEGWWRKRRRAVEETSEPTAAGTRMRAAAYRTQQMAGRLADRNAVAAKLAGVVIEQRGKAAERARNDGDR